MARRRRIRSRSRRRPFRRRLFLVLVVAIAAFAAHQAVTWPDVGSLAEHPPATTAFIERGRTVHGEVDWQWVPYARIAPTMKQAALVGEDIGFFDHQGFAFGEMRAALRATVKEGRALRGASTISQQLVKNLWLSPSRNPWRKVKEAMLTVALERRLTKQRILEIYLNVVELGPGVYGVEAAAQRYFGRPAATLSSDQAARLAAALPSPRRWHPHADSDTARQRATRIRGRMARATWLMDLL